jgi:hypothetical protein
VGEARPVAQTERVVERRRVAEHDRHRLDLHVRETCLHEQPSHLVCERAVAKRALGAEPEDALRKLLVGHVHDLRPVVGIDDDYAAARLHHAHQLAQRSDRIGEVLEGAVGPGAVEALARERE